ncbi:MAG: ribonuclease III [Cyanothece sp. SIO2G6]|nr:ribonuclease III [Cyanothece sp. SIO2G6]
MMLSTPGRHRQLQQFLAKLGLVDVSRVNWALLDRALTHSTFSQNHYEQLEFVGDAVLRLVASDFLLTTYPHLSEGGLSAIRAVLVSDRTLAQIGDRYGLERYILTGASARGDKVGRESRVAAAFEALLAALYLSTHDCSLIQCWFEAHLQEFAESIRRDPTWQNYKGALQRLTQGRYHQLPDYRVTEVGTTYGDKERFHAEVWLQGRCWGQGKGQSKKAAEQAAAQMAFLALQQLQEDVAMSVAAIPDVEKSPVKASGQEKLP